MLLYYIFYEIRRDDSDQACKSENYDFYLDISMGALSLLKSMLNHFFLVLLALAFLFFHLQTKQLPLENVI